MRRPPGSTLYFGIGREAISCPYTVRGSYYL